jgi:hypothetical protein
MPCLRWKIRNMPTLPQLIPDAETLLALAPEELAFYVLRAAIQATQNNLTSLDSVIAPLHQRGRLGQVEYVYGQRYADIEIAVAEAWMWTHAIDAIESAAALIAASRRDTPGWPSELIANTSARSAAYMSRMETASRISE